MNFGLVQPWIEKFPDSRIHIRNYSDVLTAGGSTEDFINQINLSLPENLISIGHRNKSLPRAAMEIVRRGNFDLEPDQAKALSNYFLSDEPCLKSVPNKEIEVFGGPLRAELAERFAPIHDYLSAQVGRPAFFPDITEMTQERPVPEHQATAKLLAQIDLGTLPNETLRGYIETLRRDDLT